MMQGEGARSGRLGYMVAGDALRALAALMVVVYHVTYTAATHTTGAAGRGIPARQLMEGAYGRLGGVFENLNAGVYIFFVLTGYFVGGPYVRAWLGIGDRPNTGRYLSRRLRRIVPAFWVFAAISIVAMHPAGSGLDVLSVFAFAQNYHPSTASMPIVQAWTLDIEATFYVALPLAAMLLTRVPAARPLRARRAVVAFGVLAGLLAASLAAQPSFPTLGSTSTMILPTMFWAFVPGLGLAIAEPFVGPRLAAWRAGPALGNALIGAAVAAFALLAHDAATSGLQHMLLLLAGSALLVGGMLCRQWSGARTGGWFVNRATSALGRWSYGIYLVHVVLVVEVLRLTPAGWGPGRAALLAGALAAPAAVLAAGLSWRLLERPILEWHDRPRVPAPSRLGPTAAASG